MSYFVLLKLTYVFSWIWHKNWEKLYLSTFESLEMKTNLWFNQRCSFNCLLYFWAFLFFFKIVLKKAQHRWIKYSSWCTAYIIHVIITGSKWHLNTLYIYSFFFYRKSHLNFTFHSVVLFYIVTFDLLFHIIDCNIKQ